MNNKLSRHFFVLFIATPMKNLLFTFAAIAFALCSCSSDEEGESMKASEISLNPMEMKVNEVSNTFAGKLLCAATEMTPDENIAFSPLSLQMALSMLTNGADGDTYNELVKGLGFEGMDLESINSYNSKLLKVLPAADRKVELSIANSIWTGEAYPVYEEYINTCAKAYKANVGYINLQDELNTLKTVNTWVSDNTKGRVTEVLSKLKKPEDAAFILANALYFKGEWTEKFDKKNTKPTTFHNYDGSESMVEMMCNGKAKAITLDDNRYVCLSMPYGNKSFSFDILYPMCYEKSLGSILPTSIIEDAENWLKHNTIPAFKTFGVDATIDMPKFSQTWKFDGVELLKSMGITKAFDCEYSDFSRLMPNDGHVSQVAHACTITVDESGAEAAASTVVEGVVEISGTIHYSFTIDHPFIYMIRENSTGAILFMGKMVKM